MRLKTLLFLTACPLSAACSSISDAETPETRFLDYSLVVVDGRTLPGPLSSLPGLMFWEGDDGSMLAVWRGQVVCNQSGSAKVTFGFRLSDRGSEVWHPIVVELALTCESAGPELIIFRNPVTGEALSGTLSEGPDMCPALSMAIPSVQALRAGYRASLSQANLPGGLDFSGPMHAQFQDTECAGG